MVERRHPTEHHYSNSNAVTHRAHGTNVSVWLLPAEFEALEALARKQNLSKAAILRKLISAYIGWSRREQMLSGELKQTAKKIEEVAKESSCYSVIHSIIQNAVDHILAVARTIELREKLEEKDGDT